MRPNSFKVGQTVKKIQTDGSLKSTIYTVVGIHKHAVWCREDWGGSFGQPHAFFHTFGANELESVRTERAA